MTRCGLWWMRWRITLTMTTCSVCSTRKCGLVIFMLVLLLRYNSVLIRGIITVLCSRLCYMVLLTCSFRNQWLWDMVDEFVYQFQSFCQYRAKMKNKTEQEIALLRQFDQAWSVYGVLNFLQALVEKSNIIQILEKSNIIHRSYAL
ncbi:PREDICTED: uncharacterized protein LOC109327758 [Lupinus angustifolius]|uniref:uncharacterized protein LOC109327758 n=1 Tax=Lupinus angustifolius TaxID=3871 RepID=UPI00092E232A|nr:PREDICTED: uncharacterized protein LOC109327758 [Lupinus angustifolius]